jgi:hypothetical protein
VDQDVIWLGPRGAALKTRVEAMTLRRDISFAVAAYPGRAVYGLSLRPGTAPRLRRIR